MSHHGDEPFFKPDPNKPEHQQKNEILRKLLDTTSFRGAVGCHPDGVLREGDEGLIQFAVGGEDGKVILDFGKPVAWIGMTPQQAMDFASQIMRHARQQALKNGEIVSVRIG